MLGNGTQRGRDRESAGVSAAGEEPVGGSTTGVVEMCEGEDVMGARGVDTS